MKIRHALLTVLATAVSSGALLIGANAGDAFIDVGKQEPITIAIQASPWYKGFETIVGLYQKQTGNKVNLDVTPFNGLLEKARNAVRSSESAYDLVNLDSTWTTEFYESGYLKPLTEIDPGFALPKEAIACGDTAYWNAEKRWRTADGGTLMTVGPNCQTHLLYYRKDLFDKQGISPPKTYDDVVAACQKLQQRPKLYGFVTRGERGDAVRFDWMPFMLGYGAKIVADPENGDFTVTLNSPEAKMALDKFVEVAKACGPENAAAIAQADVIQLMSVGRAAMAQAVMAAYPSFQDPNKSRVVGQVSTAIDPSPVGKNPGVVLAGWNLGIPKNLPEGRQKAALAFLKWFMTKDAQLAYAEAGAVPVRTDVIAELAKDPKYAWLGTYLEGLKYAQPVLGFVEGPAVGDVMGLKLNQALLGQLSSAAALNDAATEIHSLLEKSGRKTGTLPPLAN
jgi:multiple sugar transport system substrate-binding protein